MPDSLPPRRCRSQLTSRKMRKQMEGFAHGLKASWGRRGQARHQLLGDRRPGDAPAAARRPPPQPIWPFSSTRQPAGRKPLATERFVGDEDASQPRNSRSCRSLATRTSTRPATFGNPACWTLSSREQPLRLQHQGAGRSPPAAAWPAGELAGQRFSRRIQRGSPPTACKPLAGAGARASLLRPASMDATTDQPPLRHGMAGFEAGEWGPGTAIWIWRRARLSSRPRKAAQVPCRAAAPHPPRTTAPGRPRPGRGCSWPQAEAPTKPRREFSPSCRRQADPIDGFEPATLPGR